MQFLCKFLCKFFDKAKKPNRMSKNMFDRNAKLKSSTLNVLTKMFNFCNYAGYIKYY